MLLNLTLKQPSPDELKFSFSLLFRLVFLFIAVFVLGSMLAIRQFYTAPFIFAVISLLACGYTERWEFSRKEKKTVHSFGLFFFTKKTVLPFEEISHFELKEFTRGKIGKTSDYSDKKKRVFETRYNVLSLVMLSGEVWDIETARRRQREELKKNAEKIASFCGKSLN